MTEEEKKAKENSQKILTEISGKLGEILALTFKLAIEMQFINITEEQKEETNK